MDVKLFVLAFCLSAAATQAQSQLEHFTAAVTHLSSELYQQSIRPPGGNVVVSPFSAVNALVVLSQAADETQLYQLKKRLNFTETFHQMYVSYQNSIKERAREPTFIVANKLYVQKEYQINEKFQEMVTNQLMSGVEMVDFNNRNEAAKMINNFVAQKTQNGTDDVIEPESLVDTRIILMNTIYMKLSWENVRQPFTVNNNKSNNFAVYGHQFNKYYKDIEYVIFDRGWFKYADLNDFGAKAIEMRFADSDFSLLMILPVGQSHFALSETEAKLKDYNFTKIIERMQLEEVYVQIPTFKISHQVRLKGLSDELQISSIFYGRTNLSGLLQNATLTSVSDAILTTVFEVTPGNKPDKKTNDFLYKLRDLYSSDHKKFFVAETPFCYHVWDHKLETTILSGSLTDFERKNPKDVFPMEGGIGKCFDVDGKRIACTNI